MRRTSIAALVMLVVGLSALPVHSQTTGFGEPLGWIYLSDDNTDYSPDIVIPAFVPFKIYLMANLSYTYIGEPGLDASTGIQAFEASIDIPGLGGEVVIQDAVIRNESVNIGGTTNVIAGLYPAILAEQTPIDLVDYTLLLLAEGLQDVVLTIGPSTPSSFTPAAPGFSENTDIGECLNPVTGQGIECKRRFARVDGAVINCYNECPILDPTEKKSWGEIKAHY